VSFPFVETRNTVVAGGVGDGPELTLETARDLFAVEGRAPSAATLRGWIAAGVDIGGGVRLRLAARTSHAGLVTTSEAVRAFKAARDLPPGDLVDRLRDRARRDVMGADLDQDVLARLESHGVRVNRTPPDDEAPGPGHRRSASPRPRASAG